MFATIGGTLGTVLTWPFVAYLMTELGWVYTFYIPATIVLVVTALWISTVYNSPIEHPRISEEELKFIEAAQGNSVSRIQVVHFTCPRFIVLLLFVFPFFCEYEFAERTATDLMHFKIGSILGAILPTFWPFVELLFLSSCRTKIFE